MLTLTNLEVQRKHLMVDFGDIQDTQIILAKFFFGSAWLLYELLEILTLNKLNGMRYGEVLSLCGAYFNSIQYLQWMHVI